MTFDPIPNPELFTVNHDNLDKHDNYDGNLTWMSQKENNEHGLISYHKYGINHYKSKFNEDQLKIIVSELEKGNSYSNILNIIGFEDNENNRESIGNIKRGKTYQREINQMNRFID